jgi:hypothetical protein
LSSEIDDHLQNSAKSVRIESLKSRSVVRFPHQAKVTGARVIGG